MFPTFQPPREKDYLKSVEQLIVLREKAYKAPLTFPHTLSVVDQCTHPSPPQGRTERHLYLQSFLSAISRKGVLCVSFLSFRLLQQCTWSWRKNCRLGAMDGRRSTGADLPLASGPALSWWSYTESACFEIPALSIFTVRRGIFEGDWPSGTEVAQREAWAYKQLQQYQGSTVPYSYGFYTVTCFPLSLVSSTNVDVQFRLREEIVVCFVMEKLDGLKVENFLMLNQHRRHAKMLLVWIIIAFLSTFLFINIKISI